MKKLLLATYCFFSLTISYCQFSEALPVYESELAFPSSTKNIDLNNDNVTDILVSTIDDNRLGWYKNLSQGDFSDFNVIQTSQYPIDVAEAEDLDKDGDADIIIASFQIGELAYLLNNGNGTFVKQVVLSSKVFVIQSIAIADMDNNGWKDIVFSNNTDSKIEYFKNTGGNFSPRATLAPVSYGTKLYLEDVDKDNDIDVFALSEIYSTIDLLKNNGNNVFVKQRIDSVGGRIKFQDIDKDSNKDLIFFNSETQSLLWKKNLGGGNFSENKLIFQSNSTHYKLDIVDFDKDNDLDIVAISYPKILLFKNGGSALFDQPIDLMSYLYNDYTEISCLDLDSDGDLDFSFFNYISVDIALQQNDKSFSSKPLTNNIQNIEDYVLMDLKSDGIQELIVSSFDKEISQLKIGKSLSKQKILAKYPLSTSTCSIEKCDLDSDKKEDIIISTGNEIYWMKQTGDSLASPQLIPNIRSYGRLDIADLNKDGKIDFFFGDKTDQIRWYRNDGNFVFTPLNISTRVLAWHQSSLMDLDNDLDLDVVASVESGDNETIWYENDGKGNFQKKSRILSQSISDFRGADLNNDNRIDIVFGKYYLGRLDNYKYGKFVNFNKSFVGSGSLKYVGDFDMDGDIDLVDGLGQIYKNHGFGIIKPYLNFDPKNELVSIAFEDFDKDGDKDLLQINANNIYWKENLSKAQTTITGQIFLDENKNCKKDIGETGIPNVVLNLSPLSQYASTDSLGVYKFHVDTGHYVITPIIPYVSKGSLIISCFSKIEKDFKTPRFSLSSNDFAFQQTACSNLQVSIGVPNLKKCSSNNIYIQCKNEGITMIQNVEVKVKFPNELIIKSASRNFKIQDDTIIFSQYASLLPGQAQKIIITDSVPCSSKLLNKSVCFKAFAKHGPICDSNKVDSDWDGADLNVTGFCDTVKNEISMTIQNISNDSMISLTPYRLFYNDTLVKIGQVKLLARQKYTFTMPVQGKTVSLEVNQSKGNPWETIAIDAVEGCGLKNNLFDSYALGIFRNDDALATDIDCRQIRESSIYGKYVNAEPGFIDITKDIYSGKELEFSVNISNIQADTIYNVVIIDTLSANMDVETLSFNVSSQNSKISVSGQGKPVLIWEMRSMVLPGNGVLKSNGLVKYSIKPKKGLDQHTILSNNPTIYLDYLAQSVSNVSYRINDSVIEDLSRLTDIKTIITGLIRKTIINKSVLYPNPVQDILYVSISPEYLYKCSLVIFNSDGKKVKEILINTLKSEVDVNTLVPGLYIYEIFSDNISIDRSKFSKIR